MSTLAKTKKRQKFSGRPLKDTDLAVDEWIEDVIYHLNSISGKDSQVELVYDHLTGPAKDEVRIRPEADRNTASKLLDILRQTFQDAETVAQLQQRFYQRNQKADESLQSYSLILMKLVDRMGKKDKAMLGDRDLMLTERFIDGVHDHQLRREMRRFTFEHKGMSFTDFRQMVLKWTEDEVEVKRMSVSSNETVAEDEENTLQSNEQRCKPVDVKPKVQQNVGFESEMLKLMQNQQELLQKQQQQIDNLTTLVQHGKPNTYNKGQQGMSNFNRTIICYNCNGLNHMARDCPSKHNRRESASNAAGWTDRRGTDTTSGNTGRQPLNK